MTNEIFWKIAQEITSIAMKTSCYFLVFNKFLSNKFNSIFAKIFRWEDFADLSGQVSLQRNARRAKFPKMQRSCSSLLLICKRRPKGPVELSESTGESFKPKLLNKSCNFFDIGNFLKGILFAPWHLWFASKFAKFPATAIFIAQTSCDLREYLCSSIDSQGL